MRVRPVAALLVFAALAAAGCASPVTRTDTATGDHAGLSLDVRLQATGDSLIADTTLRNTRAEAAYLDADQCGRVTELTLVRTTNEPEGATYSGSLDAVKQMILRQQRSGEAPDLFAPRQVAGGSEPPPCVRPTRPVALAPGASIAERWELPLETASGLAMAGSSKEIVRAEAVESIAPDRLGFLDILPTGQAEASRAGRSVSVERPASAVLERAPTRTAVGPTRGQQFDRMIEDHTVRDFIEAQPADSWRRGTITLSQAGPYEFRAVTAGFERALTATLAPDGTVSGEVGVPGAVDRIRVFERRPATLPPGIAVIPEPDTPVLTEDVIAGRLSLPSGRLVADGALAGGAEPLPQVAPPGDYPVFVTVGRLPADPYDQVALATVAVSDVPTASWVPGTAIAVDGGTAGFTSAEGDSELLRMTQAGGTEVGDRAFDSLTAHDDVVTEAPIADGLDLVMSSSGYGDGVYNVWVGLDAAGKPTRFVIDFAIVHLGWPR